MRRRLAALGLIAAAAAAALAQEGSLRVVSQSGVEVFWEGVSLGVTDRSGTLVVSEIPPGTYRVTLARRGFRRTTAPVTITAGETRLVLRLESLAPPPQPKPAQPAESKPPAGSEEPTEPKPPAESKAPAKSGGAELGKPAQAAASSAAPAADDAGGGGLLLVLALAAVAGAGAIVVLRQRRARAAAAPVARVVRIPRPEGATVDGGGAAFLEDLRRRERHLERLVDVGEGAAEIGGGGEAEPAPRSEEG